MSDNITKADIETYFRVTKQLIVNIQINCRKYHDCSQCPILKLDICDSCDMDRFIFTKAGKSQIMEILGVE